MGQTNISIENESFLINGKLTYSEINTSKPQAHGLLMNARFIQGIFLSLSATQHGWIQTPIFWVLIYRFKPMRNFGSSADQPKL